MHLNVFKLLVIHNGVRDKESSRKNIVGGSSARAVVSIKHRSGQSGRRWHGRGGGRLHSIAHVAAILLDGSRSCLLQLQQNQVQQPSPV